MALGLGIVRIEATQLHKENLAAHPQRSAAGNDTGNRLQRLAKRVIRELTRRGSRNCVGLGTPVGRPAPWQSQALPGLPASGER